MPEITSDNVCICVPSREEMSQVVRMATTAVASRIGFNIDQADDISTAVDELFRVFITSEEKDYRTFCLYYKIKDDRLEIRSQACGGMVASSDNVGRYSRFLLESLSDKLEERPNAEGGVDVVLVKLLDQS